MTRTTSLTMLGLGLLSLGAAAIAQTSAPMASAPMERDGPGPRAPLDRAALQKSLEQRFDAQDANRDGMLSVEERKAHRTERREKMQARMFEQLDTDKNGQISKAEFAARQDGPRGERGDKMGKRHGHRGGGMMMGMMPGKMMAEYKDKAIPKATFINAGLTHFDQIDTDRDGKISPAEHEAARKTMGDRAMGDRKAMKRPAPTS